MRMGTGDIGELGSRRGIESGTGGKVEIITGGVGDRIPTDRDLFIARRGGNPGRYGRGGSHTAHLT